ncbi:MAG: glycosyltransferase [Lachnospiraceae bacterium]|nr:glycosyltransferase [Lachnospiraceae bacterium]
MNMEELNETEKIADYFLGHLDDLDKMTIEEGRNIMWLSSLAAAQSDETALKTKCLNLLYHCCFYMKRLELEELWNIYWILNRALFVDYKIELEGNLYDLYRFIYEKVKGSLTGTYEKTDDTNTELVIMVTNQFLGNGHAPTMRTLDYAYTLAEFLQKQVMILNDASFHFYPCPWLAQNIKPSYVKDYNHIRSIRYKDYEFPFLQIAEYMPDLDAINKMLQQIYRLRPGLVYNVGASCLVADLCSMFTKTVSFPCSTDIPTSMCEYLLLGRELEESDRAQITRLEPYQKIIETVVNYQLGESSLKYQRSEFGIGDDSFVVAVVGNRLDAEISEEFITSMEEILNQQDVHFLMIGLINDKVRIQNRITKIEKLHFAGSLKEAGQVIKLCNVYCNPKRSGGGRSSFEALAYGVPVVTLKFGDVYYTCGKEFAVDAYKDFSGRIHRYVTDSAYYEAAKEKALERAAVLSDLYGTQRKILDQIL